MQLRLFPDMLLFYTHAVWKRKQNQTISALLTILWILLTPSPVCKWILFGKNWYWSFLGRAISLCCNNKVTKTFYFCFGILAMLKGKWYFNTIQNSIWWTLFSSAWILETSVLKLCIITVVPNTFNNIHWFLSFRTSCRLWGSLVTTQA